jgi:hypothetical protein
MALDKKERWLDLFYKQFAPLKTEIQNLQTKLEANRKERRTLEDTLTIKEEVEELLEGLRTGAIQTDPGKSYVACYFAKQVTSTDIVKNESAKPVLYKQCPSCKDIHPVLMSYEQTFDSPDGDNWQKKAFTICPKTLTVAVYGTITKDSRF